MFAAKFSKSRHGLNKAICLSIVVNDSLKGTPCAVMQVATFMKLEKPPAFDNVEFPDRRKLRFFDKVPQMSASARPPKTMKDLYLMRGPEKIHNKLQYGDFGVQAITGGRLRWGHLEAVRGIINRKLDDSRMFAMWRIEQPWKSVSKKGQGSQMGGGKGAVDYYVFPLRADRIIVEMGGQMEFKEVKDILSLVVKVLPFRSRVVSRQMLEEEAELKAHQKKTNINPFSYEYCAKNNMLGCKTWMSPYDMEWYGEYQ